MSLALLHVCLCLRGAFAPSPSPSPGQMCNHETAGGDADDRRGASSTDRRRHPPRAPLYETTALSLPLLSLKHWLDFCPFFGRISIYLGARPSTVGSTPLPNLIPSSSLSLSTHNPCAFPCTLYVSWERASLVPRAHSLAKKRRNTLPESVALTTDRLA